MALSQRLYYINTLNKLSGTNEDFTYKIQIPQSEDYNRVVVLSACIPNTFLLIQDGFNTFTLREDSTDVTITVPFGYYNGKVFASVVGALMTSSSPHSWTYDINLPNISTQASTGQFIYTVTGNTSQPSIICTANVNEQLGFEVNSTNTFVNNSLTSKIVINFNAESTLFLHSDISDHGDTDVLQEIYTSNTQNLYYVTYQCTCPELYSKVLKTKSSNTFRFTLKNEKSQILNLRGVDMLITLCLYKRDNTHDFIRNYIKFKMETNTTQ
jgi:hypothetical protein